MTDLAFYFACSRQVERTLEHIDAAHRRGRPDIGDRLAAGTEPRSGDCPAQGGTGRADGEWRDAKGGLTVEVSAISSDKKTGVQSYCGKLTLKARDAEEAQLLAAINNVFTFGGEIRAKPKGKKLAAFAYDGLVNEPE